MTLFIFIISRLEIVVTTYAQIHGLQAGGGAGEDFS
jgi:hypothetical protein